MNETVMLFDATGTSRVVEAVVAGHVMESFALLVADADTDAPVEDEPPHPTRARMDRTARSGSFAVNFMVGL
jgi:hypothetical protein